MTYQEEVSKVYGKFNRGIDTMNLPGETMRLIKSVIANPFIPNLEKQRIKLHLIRQYFLECGFLIKNNKEVKEKVMALRLSKRNVSFVKNGQQKYSNEEYYNPELDLKLDEVLFELQTKLQESGNYLMPLIDDDDGL